MATSAGVLLFKRDDGRPAVLLVHPGGPFWVKRDRGAWSIPKGEMMAGEEPEAAARREFAEELGIPFEGPLHLLGEAVMTSAKRVIVYAGEGDIDCAAIRSNSFEIEWPPKSGRRRSFPEVDRAEWFGLAAARDKLLEGPACLPRPAGAAVQRLIGGDCRVAASTTGWPCGVSRWARRHALMRSGMRREISGAQASSSSSSAASAAR